MKRALIIEPFYGGSHKQLLDTILSDLQPNEYELFTLPAKKWHWCARIGALHFSQTIPVNGPQYGTIFTSSVLNLAELLGLRADLMRCRKVVYFHENQLCYPVRTVKDRDVQYGLNQIMSALCADRLLFNSCYNMTSFLDNIDAFLRIIPNMKLRNLRLKIEPKCAVLYFPIRFRDIPEYSLRDGNEAKPLHLIWPHRWEHDKNPNLLRDALLALNEKGVDFRVSILGEKFETIPECFEDIRCQLGEKVIHYGPVGREEYYQTLRDGDVVLSTADHEFFGVAMLEATYCGCVPLAPNRLVYPELYPPDKLFRTKEQLVKQLYNWCRNRPLFEKHRKAFFEWFRSEAYSADSLVPQFLSILKQDGEV